MQHSRPTQAQRVIKYIEDHGSITQFDAMNLLGVMRLASRISELKKQGYEIESKVEKVKNRFGETCHVKRYRLGGDSADG